MVFIEKVKGFKSLNTFVFVFSINPPSEKE